MSNLLIKSKPNVCLIMPFTDNSFGKRWDDYLGLRLIQDYLQKKGISCDYFDYVYFLINDCFSKKFILNRISEIKLQLKKDFLTSKDKTNLNILLKELSSIIKITKRKENYSDMMNISPILNPILSNPELSELYLTDFFFSKKIRNTNCSFNSFIELIKTKKAKKLYNFFLSSIKQNDFSKYDVFGITIPTFLHFFYGLIFSKALKKIYPDKHICVGGAMLSYIEKQSLEKLVKLSFFDSFILYEGEKSFYNLINECQNKEIKGQYNSIKINLNEQIIEKTNKTSEKLIFSKGCYYGKCNFCDFKESLGNLSIKKIDILLNEIINLNRNYNVSHFHLLGEAMPPNYAKLICQKIFENKLKITWSCEFMRIDNNFTIETLDLMKQTGFDFSKTAIGVESFLDDCLNYINKGYENKDITLFFEKLRKLKIRLKEIYLIKKLPKETYKNKLIEINTIEDYLDCYNFFEQFTFVLSKSSNFYKNVKKFNEIILLHKNNLIASPDNQGNTHPHKLKNPISKQSQKKLDRFYKNLLITISILNNYKSLDRIKFAKIHKISKQNKSFKIKFGNDFNNKIKRLLYRKDTISKYNLYLKEFISKNDLNKYYDFEEIIPKKLSKKQIDAFYNFLRYLLFNRIIENSFLY